MPAAATRTRTRVERGIYLEHTRRGPRYVVTYTDGAGRQRTGSHSTLEAARLARATAAVDRARGVAVDLDGARLRLEEYAALYADGRVWRPSTVARFESMLGTILGPLSTRELGTLRPSDVRGWLAAADRAGYAPSTVAAAYSLLSSLLESAAADRYIPANPCRGIRAPRAAASAASTVAALDPSTFAALVTALPVRLRPAARLMAATGLRPSEAAGLTVDRVDYLRRRLVVDRQLTGATGGVPTFGPPKTPSSVREVPVPAVLLEDLARLAESPGPEGLLLTTTTGAPWTRGRRADAWTRAVRGLELPPAVRGWHALRHTYASNALAAGVPLVTVSRILGHRSTIETQSTYAHLLASEDVDAHAATVAAALGLERVVS